MMIYFRKFVRYREVVPLWGYREVVPPQKGYLTSVLTGHIYTLCTMLYVT